MKSIEAFKLIAKPWTPDILCTVACNADGIRFSELQRKILRINPRMLTFRLNELRYWGLIKKVDRHYFITEKGNKTVDSLEGLWKTFYFQEMEDA